MTDPSVLFAIAEIAVAIAGFSAIVVLFRRRDSGRWLAADADRFNGMVLHAMAAAFFSLWPSVLGVFVADPAWLWSISSALLGVQIAAHVAAVLWFATTNRESRIVLLLGLAIAALQGANALGLAGGPAFGPYLIGVVWHVLQSGVLFVWLIMIPREDVEPDADDAGEEEADRD